MSITFQGNIEVVPSLPLEVWEHVATYATLCTLLQMRITCHTWRNFTNVAYERILYVRDHADIYDMIKYVSLLTKFRD